MIYVYSLGPIDFWAGMLSEAEYREKMHAEDVDHIDEVYIPFFDQAKELARSIGWEGDIRQGPFISALPTEDNYHPFTVIAWKQDNNGATFVASQYELPWLGKPAVKA